MRLSPKNWTNVNGTSTRRCNCKTWKSHWENYAFRRGWPSRCSVLGCSNVPTVGAHVRKNNGAKNYIVPMCSSCNGKRNSVFHFKQNTMVVLANRRLTCD